MMIEFEENYNRMCEFIDRATGRTTRLVDKYVQELYNNPGEWIDIIDHYYVDGKPCRQSCEIVLKKLMRRLSLEHPMDEFETKRNGKYPCIRLSKFKIHLYKKEVLRDFWEKLNKLFSK